jgi:thiamine biosynthesis protein ThiS
LTLSELVEELSLAPSRIAVELNGEVVRRDNWAATVLSEEDRLEVVHFVGGGEQRAAGFYFPELRV